MSGAPDCYTATDISVCRGSPLLNTGIENASCDGQLTSVIADHDLTQVLQPMALSSAKIGKKVCMPSCQTKILVEQHIQENCTSDVNPKRGTQTCN